MLLEGVTQFAVGGFLRGVDGSLGDTHAAGDFGVGHAFHGKADDGAHLRREGVDRLPHEAVSLLLQIILLEGLVALAADGFNGLGVDRLAFQLIEAAVARHCVKIASHLVDVIEGSCRLKQALIKDKRYPGLFLLPAAQTRDKNAVSPEQMKKLCQNIRDMGFEYIIIDCPAGIEQGFKNAIAGADRAVVVTTPEVSAVRDADRIIGLLEANGLNNPGLIVNRIKMDMVKRGDMMSVEDVKEILSVDVLGVVPDDEAVVVTTNRGEPAVADDSTRAGRAYRNITSRILGEDVPLMSLDENEGFFGKIKKMFAR